MEGLTGKEFSYDAFISYRHCDKDMFVAQSLHRYLESFKLPNSVRKSHPGIKTKIERVFRDKEELPLVSNLGDPIREALSNSDYLIVICTPRLRESLWCRTEIETFIAMHGRQKVFAVLAEGEPSESFPEALLKDEDGNPCEPLAANFRGETNADVKRKMKDEGLRLLAPMFGLNFDELKQRHREQRLKRIIAAASAVSVAGVAFGAYSTATALMIDSQKKEIERQAVEIENQYMDSQKKYEISTAKTSEKMMTDGRRNDALYALRAAMPSSASDRSIPYAPEAEKALADALGVYSTGDMYYPVDTYTSSAGVRNIAVSNDGSYLAILDEAGYATVMDVWENAPLHTWYTGPVDYGQDGMAFAGESTLVAYDEDGEFLMDMASGDTFYISDYEGYLAFSPDGEKVMVVNAYGISCADVSSFESLFEISPGGLYANATLHTAGCFSPDGRYFMTVLTGDSGDGMRDYLVTIDVEAAELVSENILPAHYDSISSLCTDGEKVYICGGFTYNGLDYRGVVLCVDRLSGDILWTTGQSASRYYGIRYDTDESGAFVCAHDRTGFLKVSAETGETIYYAGLDFSIENAFPVLEGGSELVIGTNGELATYDPYTGEAGRSYIMRYENNNIVSACACAGEKLFISLYGSDYVTRYGYLRFDKMKDTGADFGYTDISPDGKTGVICEIDPVTLINHYSVYDIENGLMSDEFDSDGEFLTFIGDGSEGFVLSGKTHELYDLNAGMLSDITLSGTPDDQS